MAEEVGAVVLQCGPIRLVLGDDEALAATELIGAGDVVRVGVGELSALDGGPGGVLPPEAAIVTDAGLESSRSEVVSVSALGVPRRSVVEYVEALDEVTKLRVVMEAALLAWRHRIAGIADALGAISAADSDVLGPIDVVG